MNVIEQQISDLWLYLLIIIEYVIVKWRCENS